MIANIHLARLRGGGGPHERSHPGRKAGEDLRQGHRACRRLDARSAWGETLGILGDNGAGKSTLIKILTGYHQPDSGQVFVDGKTGAARLGRRGPRARHRMRLPGSGAGQRAQHLPQHVFEPRIAARRAAAAPGPSRDAAARGRGAGGDRRRRASVELEVGALSGGQRQAIAVARAVLFEGAHPAARRAARGDGRARGAADHRADRAAPTRAATSRS